jgi:hypothetical protein
MKAVLPMFIPMMALLLVFPASFASSAPLSATIPTTYGDIRITQIEVIQREWDSPCGFAAHALNSSPVPRENATFAITVSGGPEIPLDCGNGGDAALTAFPAFFS